MTVMEEKAGMKVTGPRHRMPRSPRMMKYDILAAGSMWCGSETGILLELFSTKQEISITSGNEVNQFPPMYGDAPSRDSDTPLPSKLDAGFRLIASVSSSVCQRDRRMHARQTIGRSDLVGGVMHTRVLCI